MLSACNTPPATTEDTEESQESRESQEQSTLSMEEGGEGGTYLGDDRHCRIFLRMMACQWFRDEAKTYMEHLSNRITDRFNYLDGSFTQN